MTGRSYNIVGAGALGAYYGACLFHAGRPVRFLLRGDFDHVRSHGLRVDSPAGDLSIAEPEIYPRPEDMPASDVVLVGLKTTQNPLLGDLLPPVTAQDAVVLTMQNGLGIEEETARAVPGRTILGGLAFLCSNKLGPGHVKHLDYGPVRLAEYCPGGGAAGVTPAMEAVAADLRAGGIRVDLEEDLSVARWKKLVWNVPYNGLCVVHDCTTDVLMGKEATRRLCEEIMNEVRSIAGAYGHEVSPRFVQAMLDDTAAMAPYKPSMKLDHERGQPLEIDALYERPIRAAREAGVPCPRIEALYEELRRLAAAG